MNNSTNSSIKEKFSGSDSNCTDDLSKPFNKKIKGYNDDLLYENKTNKPWQHHDVQGSLPVDNVVKYTKAYYYEFDNKKYMDRLKTALTVPCTLLADAVNDSSWSALTSLEDVDVEETYEVKQEVLNAYNACIQNVATKLNTSSAMILPGYIDKVQNDTTVSSADIQVVHDIMKSYRTHLKEKSMYLIDMELLLYRESKFEGKHVKISCTAKFLPNKKIWFTNVVAVDLLGVVPEDQIALFPVNAYDLFGTENLRVENDVSANTNPLFTIKCKVDKKKNNTVVCSGVPSNTLKDNQSLNKLNKSK